ncbi:ATP-binding protein [Streptomyces luteolifulvus]|uniref:ATP-binding protein n=2 Tax=Streptomyces luteolifulvus TaxID=2615112 RepID=A0A6H9UW63_9ACTN|nr:ATP-binding protein [Streptomyces luteolifulvus]
MTDMVPPHTKASAAPTVAEGDSPAGIARARNVARAFAEGLDPAQAPEATETLALAVSELATNALRHDGGRYTLELEATAGAIHIAVSDLKPALPRERAPDLNGGAGGFGWPMARRPASEVTITPGPGPGKTTRVRLPR